MHTTKVFAIAGATEHRLNTCNSIVLQFRRDEQSRAKVLNFGNRKLIGFGSGVTSNECPAIANTYR